METQTPPFGLTASSDRATYESTPVSATAISALRRSVSIFSRSGCETPVESPAHTLTAASSRPSHTHHCHNALPVMRPVTSKSSKTRSTKAARLAKGTVLNAVPPREVIKMTRLEEEMVTGPNQEILSDIDENEHTVHAGYGVQSSPRVSPIQEDARAYQSQPFPTCSARRTYDPKQTDKHNQIGVWINGVAHWDDSIQGRRKEKHLVANHPASASNGVSRQRQGKPLLSVVIPTLPTSTPSTSSDTMSEISRPKPRRPTRAIAPPVSSRSHRPAIVEEVARSMEVATPKKPHIIDQRQRTSSIVPRTSYSQHRQRSSNSRGSANTDDDSEYSRHSSETSGRSRRSSSATSVEDDEGPSKTAGLANKDKPLPPLPRARPPKAVPDRLISASPTTSSHSTKTVALFQNVDVTPLYATVRPRRSLSTLEQCDRDFLKTSPYSFPYKPKSVTPTLSEAEQELVISLDMSSQNLERHQHAGLVRESMISRSDSVKDVMHPSPTAPLIPPRSRKRDWVPGAKAAATLPAPRMPSRRRSNEFGSVDLREYRSLVELAKDQTMRRTTSLSPNRRNSAESLPAQIGGVSNAVPVKDFSERAGQLPQRSTQMERPDHSLAKAHASTTAENVLLHILASLHSMKDLHNMAVINKGMYRVFKENEMDLIRTVTYNQCPSAWELREWSSQRNAKTKEGSADVSPMSLASSIRELENTPAQYMLDFRRDRAVITRLKVLVLEKCQTFLRKETKFALMHPNHPSANWVNDAFYRIWSFCKIFGCNKGREEDITGQLDWLKGGLLANNQGCGATVNTTLDFDMGSVLLNPPEHFAKGNKGGLEQGQLFDITEIWSCMAVLLQSYHGRVKQARAYGIFDDTGVLEGDSEQEELLLGEWIAYVLTLGPDVVLEMAEHANDTSDIGFAVARACGWTRWTAPTHSGSRITFLKESVSRSYEQQVTTAKEKRLSPLDQELKELRRQRVANMAAEIRLKRQTSEYLRQPLIDMESERPMSIWTIKSGAPSPRVAEPRNDTIQQREPTPSAAVPVMKATILPSKTSESDIPVRMTDSIISPVTATAATADIYAQWGDRKVSPVEEVLIPVETANANNAKALRVLGIDVEDLEDLSDRAVATIMGLGFTKMEASNALKITDEGDGIRLDRAVEWCLRQRW